MKGLCGNFNDIMSDDFRVTNGLVEGTAAAFANAWKTRASCPDIISHFGDPCNNNILTGTDCIIVVLLYSCIIMFYLIKVIILYEKYHTALLFFKIVLNNR